MALTKPLPVALLISLPVVELNKTSSASTELEGPTTSPVPGALALRVPAEKVRLEPIVTAVQVLDALR